MGVAREGEEQGREGDGRGGEGEGGEGFPPTGQATGHLLDNAGIFICDHGVVVAVEGADGGQLPGQDGISHPVLQRHVPADCNKC